jgi:methyl-accepting chemotaxis protein
MLRHMTLGKKIAAGFGLLIALAMALGGVAVVKMMGVVENSEMLAEEYTPESALASDLERRINRTMFAVRGYNYTGEKKFYDEGTAAIGQVKETIAALEKLAASAAHLVKLKGALGEIQQTMAGYERLLGDTHKQLTAQQGVSDQMLALAKKYMEQAYAYLKSQEKELEKEIAEGAPPESLLERKRKITRVNDLIDLGNDARIANLGSRAWRDNKVMQEGIQKIFPEIEKAVRELEPISRQPVNKQQLKEILAAAEAYRGAMVKFTEIQAEIDRMGAERLVLADKALAAARELMKTAGDQTHALADKSKAELSTAKTTVTVGLGVALLVGVLLAFFITRSVTRPVQRIIAGLSEGAQEVAAAAGQVSAASQSLSEGATQQAASLEETSSSLEEMASMTKQNANNAQQANGLMGEAKQVVGTANSSMGRLIGSMGEISRASEETSKIVKTIDEIAFQTNLLALNAAVEAARAGEAGAGFAVVADEVRNLAMRAAEAAKNTANLIEDTVKKVKEGGELVAQTNAAFGEVAGSAAKVSDLVAEIAAASNEQAQGISQINTAVTELDKVTQNNAASAEESASAAEEMSAQAETMKGMVAELAAMVAGSARRGAADSGGEKPAAQRRPASSVAHAVRKLAVKAGAKNPNKAGAKNPKKSEPSEAEKMIPLDEGFADF